MRLIHTKGFAVQERRQWKVTIFQNLLHAFQVVFDAMEEQEVAFANPNNIVSLGRAKHEILANFQQRYAEIVAADPEIGPGDAMPIDCLNAFRGLWSDDGVQLAIQKGHEYALHDNLT